MRMFEAIIRDTVRVGGGCFDLGIVLMLLFGFLINFLVIIDLRGIFAILSRVWQHFPANSGLLNEGPTPRRDQNAARESEEADYT